MKTAKTDATQFDVNVSNYFIIMAHRTRNVTFT